MILPRIEIEIEIEIDHAFELDQGIEKEGDALYESLPDSSEFYVSEIRTEIFRDPSDIDISMVKYRHRYTYIFSKCSILHRIYRVRDNFM